MASVRSWLPFGAGLLACALASADVHAGGPAPSAATATKVVAPDGPGSVHGLGDEASVNVFSAQVAYAVPMELPAGRGGFAPALSLTYSGELGNGPVGIGWTLGMPAIRRSTRHGVPSFTTADELELTGLGAGGRLVSIGGGEYRAEGQGNALRVVAENARFVVTDNDGTIYYFGLTEASRQEGGAGRIAAWYPELVVHRSGESLLFFYGHDRGQIYLEGMAWGPSYRFEADLEYETRPDQTVSYREGFQVVTGRRLARVIVTSAGTVLRTYHLDYDESRALGRLARVRMTGFQDQGELPALRLAYAAPGPAEVRALGGLDGWQLESRGVAFFDVDGDGMEDLYRLEMGNHEYRRNLGGTFGPRTVLPGATALELDAVRFIDLDGDARAELVRIVDDTWRYSRLVDGSWTTGGTWTGSENVPISGAGTEITDLNGDGRMDVVRAVTGGLEIHLGGASGLVAPVFRSAIDASNAFIEPGASNVQFVDVNGDGLSDVVWLNDAWMKVFLGRGDGTFYPWRRTFYPWTDQAVDVRDLRLADLDRDGLIDLVRFTAGHVLLFPGRADGAFSWLSRPIARPDPVDTDVTVAIADANGNGSPDIVWSSPRGMWLLDLAGPTSAGMLATIDNGMGKVVDVAYGASAQLSVAAELAGEPWARKLPVSIPVPTAVTTDVGVGPARVVHHGVRDGFWDAIERRFGGFLEGRTSLTGASGADVKLDITRYHAGEGAERVLRGKEVEERIENGLGEVLSIGRTEWAAHPVAGLPDTPLLRVPVTREVRTSHLEGVPEPIDTLEWFVHDDQARVVEDHDLGRLDRSGDEAIRTLTYATNNESRWIRDRVCQEDLWSDDGVRVSRTQTFYGERSGLVAAFCQLGDLGLERKTRVWFTEESRWIFTETTTYSQFLNPLTVYAGGVTRTLVYDGDDLHLTRERVTPVTGQTLSWDLGWDAARELPSSVTDAAGAVTHVTYDGVGRLATVGLGSAPPHVRYLYDWSAPRPTTSTYVFDGAEADLGTWSGGYVEGAGWRETVAVANGAGEPLFTATRLTSGRFIIGGFTERDGRGRTSRVFDSFHADLADPRASAPPMGTRADEVTYDAFDRLVQHRRPSGALRRVGYFAFGRQVTDDDLAAVTTLLDGQGRVIRSERTIGGAVEAGEASYDPADHLVSLRLQPGTAQEVEHTFEYDGLGRLTFASDPDIGDRFLVHNDDGFLVEATNAAGQSIEYGYDGAGRVTSVLADDGSAFTYHYDTPQDASYQFTAGRLAWVEEGTGTVQLGYDARGRQTRFQRTIVDSAAGKTLTAEEAHVFSPSGLLRSVDFLDGLTVDLAYDDAGRPTRVGGLWAVGQYDPAGRILGESFGNGVTQAYSFDANGDLASVAVRRPPAAGATLLYQASVTRNGFAAITSVTDSDGTGLDHNASFTYDPAGRLTDATLGPLAARYQFHYAYDGLQNMIQRGASGPTTLGALTGEYHYGGPRSPIYGGGTHGPRQLTSVQPLGGGTPTATFQYDLAGRLVRQDGLSLTYNGLDQLTHVSGLSAGFGTVSHAYGYDGFRVLTRSTAGATQYWFTPGVSERGGLREHYIRLGDRLLARVDQRELPPGGGGGLVTVGRDPRPARALLLALLALSLVLLGRVLFGSPVRSRARAAAVASLALAAGLVQSGCFLFGSSDRPLWEHASTIYFHHGISPGPTLITREDGTVLEERRYEPFGEEVNALREPAGGGTPTTGAIDYSVDAHNILNKQSDPDTGWSYHGARWMAPESARWLTPDPPVKAPDPTLAAEPWSAHPYQYVNQNPIAFWDPDGRDVDDVFRFKVQVFQDKLGMSYVEASQAAAPINGGTAAAILVGAFCEPCGFFLGAALSDGDSEGPILRDALLGGSPRAAGRFGSTWRAAEADGFWAAWGGGRGVSRAARAEVSGGESVLQAEHTVTPTSKRWQVGDDIYAPTKRGEPSWTTVQNRYWKNEAAGPGASEKWGAENISRMKRGRAPQRYNPDKDGMESMELSHEPVARRDGGRDLVPRWPQDHAAVDPYRHPGY
jgi:RHS repeat-associated protein